MNDAKQASKAKNILSLSGGVLWSTNIVIIIKYSSGDLWTQSTTRNWK